MVEVVYNAPSAATAPTRSLRFVHADPLGSTDALTDEKGAVVEQRSYDPFGAPRDPTWTATTPPGAPALTSVGFTGHEDDRELGLVHMKGRLYDLVLSRFLQPDPVVQAPGFSQNWQPVRLRLPLAFALHRPERLAGRGAARRPK